jgi:sugar fermentation stimulation protein A
MAMNKGVYCLVIRMENTMQIKIGKLGTFKFPSGYYVYTGSAFNNLKSRVARHFRRDKRKRWHIDYLLEKAEIMHVFTYKTDQRMECKLNNAIFHIPEAIEQVPKFGSSDCKCRAHLAYFTEDPTERISGLIARE